ncbi:MAG: hypothetical protein ACD_81C00089G0015 [uncultured bacterium]|uniref:DUF362 domain-containing protein n=1 Tax=Candidatus Wolfebacteria bacterium GW2011_GWE2_44_13 TaxID=1619017 RepID=A0A0G1H9T2_9BACT|nr:MAG: hypothetical protein ACD_81C00089G0015 [uncultured bacterium]KKT43540.1 MAG: hypothetical protein UW32_C0001G0132 [Candidatus Wolfebacteria bacterium GW2011_GWE2_44_13]
MENNHSENSTLDSRVFLSWTKKEYPSAPYNSQADTYKALVRLFEVWGLDKQNPFKDFVHEGQKALIKPNWVRDYNPLGFSIESLITHPSIISHLMDFLAIAMYGKGTIIIADAPLQNSDFDKLTDAIGMKDIVKEFKKKHPDIECIVEDWRLTKLKRVSVTESFKNQSLQVSKDNFGHEHVDTHVVVDAGAKSFLEEVSDYAKRFRVTNYKPSLMVRHHCPGKHEYLVTKRIFEVDFMINVPKMKTHIKAGLTGAQKNLIGINGHKEYLPHHIKGPYFKGGDNYCMPNWFKERYEDVYDFYWEHFSALPMWKRKLVGLQLKMLWSMGRLTGRDTISAGSWRGNDTIWRTTLDLNHILYFSERSPKKIINIIDGIVAGEAEGPLSPEPKAVGVLIGGENPAYVDAVMGKLMGYNIARIPTVHNAIYSRRSQFAGPFMEDFSVIVADANGNKRVRFDDLPDLAFKKPRYWESAKRG